MLHHQLTVFVRSYSKAHNRTMTSMIITKVLLIGGQIRTWSCELDSHFNILRPTQSYFAPSPWPHTSPPRNTVSVPSRVSWKNYMW